MLFSFVHWINHVILILCAGSWREGFLLGIKPTDNEESGIRSDRMEYI